MNQKDPERSLENLISGFELEAGRIKRLYNEKRFNIAVIGTGVGTSIGYNIAHMISRNKKRLEKLVISNRNEDKAKKLKMNIMPDVNCEVRKYGDVNKWLFDEEIDIAIVCVGGFAMERDEELPANFPIIGELAPCFRGYKGATIIVTNPVDTIAYQFAVLSGCNPYSILGFSQLDPVRGEIMLLPRIEESARDKKMLPPSDITLHIIGAHNVKTTGTEKHYCMIPYLDETLLYGTTPISWMRYFTNELYEKLKKDIGEYGDKQYNEYKEGKITGKITAANLASTTMNEHVLRAFADPNKIISMAIWDPKRELYVTWPTRIIDFMASPLTLKYFNGSMYEVDFERVVKEVLVPNIQFLRKRGLVGKPAKAVEPVERSYKGKLHDLRRETVKEFDEKITDIKDKNIEKRLRQKYEDAREEVDNLLKEGVEVIIPTNLEMRLYASDVSAKGKVKRISEFDFRKEEPRRYFEFETGKYSSYKKVFCDGINLYALYQRTTREAHKHEYGAVVWDLREGKFKIEIKFDIASKDVEPSSLFVHNEDLFISFSNQSIKRYCKDGRIIDYSGVDSIFDLVVADLPSGTSVFGIKGGNIYSWREDVPKKPSGPIDAERNLRDIRFYKNGINLLSCSSNDSAVLINLDENEIKHYTSSRGIHDIEVLEDDSIALATLHPDHEKVQVRLFDSASRLMTCYSETTLDPESDKPDLRPYPDVRSLRFAKDLLIIRDTDNKQHIINWKDPELKPILYAPLSANLAYSTIIVK